MTSVFVDAAFYVGLILRDDDLHVAALAIGNKLRTTSKVTTTPCWLKCLRLLQGVVRDHDRWRPTSSIKSSVVRSQQSSTRHPACSSQASIFTVAVSTRATA